MLYIPYLHFFPPLDRQKDTCFSWFHLNKQLFKTGTTYNLELHFIFNLTIF